MKPRSFRILSFSGIDGAGKSTQISALLNHLEERGDRVKLYTFWDNVVAFSKYRERASLSVFKGEKGVGSPDHPVARRDKNVMSWYVTLARLVLYSFDVLRLTAFVAMRSADCEFLIFDRYIYDELANLPLWRWEVRQYVRFLLCVVPKPDVAFLLDADPEEATSRKPEYPVEFVRRNRNAYLTLACIAGMNTLPPSSISEVSQAIRQAIDSLQQSAGSDAPPRRHILPLGDVKTPSG